jgi:catechol 2,3-dioxygenase-like lactoylglutathione lyase family enzyme
MPIRKLQHINIRCADAEKSKQFYADLLGLKIGPRPPFASRGYWLYADEDPVVHLVEKRPGEKRLGPGTGDLDHVAFEGLDLAATRKTLQAGHYDFRETLVPRDNVTQLFVSDPDGIMLELNFAPDATLTPAPGGE